MKTIEKIELTNIQAHEKFTMMCPEGVVIRCKGNNSAGKSIVPNVISDIIKCSFNDPKRRRSYVRNGCLSGMVSLYRNDGAVLNVNIALEAASTYYEVVKGDKAYRRYLSDKNLDALVSAFGFHYNADRDFSLNIYETYSPLLMINTSMPTNFDIIDEAISSTSATSAIENFETIMEQAEEDKGIAITEMEKAEAALSVLKEYNLEEETKRLNKVEFYSRAIELLEPFDLPEIKGYVDISHVSLLDIQDVRNSLFTGVHKEVNLEAVKLLNLVLESDMPSVDREVSNLIKVLNQECPYCGQKLFASDEEVAE